MTTTLEKMVESTLLSQGADHISTPVVDILMSPSTWHQFYLDRVEQYGPDATLPGPEDLYVLGHTVLLSEQVPHDEIRLVLKETQ